MENSSDKLIIVSQPTRHLAGAMSGTSADGVDVAIVRIEGRGLDMRPQLVRHHYQPYPKPLQDEIFSFRGGEIGGSNVLSRLAAMGREISLTYARAVNDALRLAGMTAEQLSAVAAHGQTLFHDPPSTIQWFDPALLAAEVGCAVVSDFRRADLAAGGQGAPLVPFADFILFRHPTKNRVLLNIGGIANITWLPAGATLDQVVAFDTGPGNCISDHLMRTRAGEPFDDGGALASKGTINHDLAYEVNDDYYFYQPPPKSTDTPTMIALYEKGKASLKLSSMSLEDELATACFITAHTIAKSWENQLRVKPDEIIASGGGTANAVIMRGIAGRGIPVVLTGSYGVDSQSKEALAFALLGAATLDGMPSNVPSVTGAKRTVVLGSVTPKP